MLRIFRFINHLVPKVYDLFKAMSPDAPVYRGNWAVFHDLDGVLDLYTPTGHVERNEVSEELMFIFFRRIAINTYIIVNLHECQEINK